jgi:putative transposase
MTRPYPVDLRDRVVAAVEQEGLWRHQAAARFGVAVSTAVHRVRRYRTTGSVAPGKVGWRKQRVLGRPHRGAQFRLRSRLISTRSSNTERITGAS